MGRRQRTTLKPSSHGYDGYIFFLWGQSNNTSRYTSSGNLPPSQTGILPNVKVWQNITTGNPVDDSFGNYESGVSDSYGLDYTINGTLAIYSNQAGKFGISNPLAYALTNTYNKKVYFVPMSVGGVGLDPSLTPHTWASTVSNNLYDFALPRCAAAYAAAKLLTPNIKPVILWLGNETDALTLTPATNILTNLVNIINDSRTDLGALNSDLLDIEWIIPAIRPDISPYPYPIQVRSAQVDVCDPDHASYISGVRFFDTNTDRTPISSDGAHYNPISASWGGTQSALNLGADLADAVKYWFEGVAATGYIQALGGNIIVSGDYKYRDFTADSILEFLNVPTGVLLDKYLLIGGGGSGGQGSGTAGGGGGGGQALPGYSLAVSVSRKRIKIGLGGGQSIAATGYGINGLPTTFFGLSALGGGGGGGFNAGINGLNGGNGGGGGDFNGGGAVGLGGMGDFNGGNGNPFTGGAGGGGGAGGDGNNGAATSGGNGGVGYTWIDGITYGGGGGGAATTFGHTQGLGGSGGGGKGQVRSDKAATSGINGLGGGGGGVSADGDVGALSLGGSGRVKVKIKFQN